MSIPGHPRGRDASELDNDANAQSRKEAEKVFLSEATPSSVENLDSKCDSFQMFASRSAHLQGVACMFGEIQVNANRYCNHIFLDILSCTSGNQTGTLHNAFLFLW